MKNISVNMLKVTLNLGASHWITILSLFESRLEICSSMNQIMNSTVRFKFYKFIVL